MAPLNVETSPETQLLAIRLKLWRDGIPSRLLRLPEHWWANGHQLDAGHWIALDSNKQPWIVEQTSRHPLKITPLHGNRPAPEPEQLSTVVLSLWPKADLLNSPARLSLRPPHDNTFDGAAWGTVGLQQMLRLPLAAAMQLEHGLGAGLVKLQQQLGDGDPQIIRQVARAFLLLLISNAGLWWLHPHRAASISIALCLWLLISVIKSIQQQPLQRQQQALHNEADRRSLALLNISSSLRLAGAEQRAIEHWRQPLTTALGLRRRHQRLDALAWGLGGAIAVFCLMQGRGETLPLLLIGAQCIAVSQLTSHLPSLLDHRQRLKLHRDLMNVPAEWQADAREPGELKGQIQLDNIRVRYGSHLPLVLKDLSFELPARSFVAVVGASGSGKSTLLQLLLGFLEPEQGRILFDGIDSRQIQQDLLRPQIGTVLQSSRLIGDTIRDALLAGRDHPDTALLETLDAVGFSQDLPTLPLGLDTPLPGGGRLLSGGQSQKLALARALLGQPRLLLLDEPTSALDQASQDQVMATLQALPVTRLLIAHRLSTVKRADRILVLEHGRLVQQGRFDELRHSPGRFAELMRHQEV